MNVARENNEKTSQILKIESNKKKRKKEIHQYWRLKKEIQIKTNHLCKKGITVNLKINLARIR